MYNIELAVGQHMVTVAAFEPADAKIYGPLNWSLRPLQQPNDIHDHELLTSILSHVFFNMDTREVFAPDVSKMSGNIVLPADLTDKICLGQANLHRNRQRPADGIFLKDDEAFAMSAAGCPLILASAGSLFIAAHAGRDSLIDRGAIMNKPTRYNISVVDAIILEFEQRGASVDDIIMVMQFAIPADMFEHNANHPEYGEFNLALATFVEKHWQGGIVRKNGKTFLDLEKVFVEQAWQAGIQHVWAEHSLAEYPRLAHTRDGKGADRRNLIVVRRDS